MQNALAKPQRKQIRSAHDRTKPDLRVKPVLRSLAKEVAQKTRTAFNKWKDSIRPSNNMIKGERLRNVLQSIPRRTMKDGLIRILNKTDRVA